LKGPDEHITACGGVVFRLKPGSGAEVLLIYRNGLWDLPKGKRDPGESLYACAAREISEEVGCATPCLLDLLCHTHHTYEHKSRQILKTTWWFAMVTPDEQFLPQLEEGITEIRWVPIKQAMGMVGFDNLTTALHSFEDWIRPHLQLPAP